MALITKTILTYSMQLMIVVVAAVVMSEAVIRKSQHTQTYTKIQCNINIANKCQCLFAMHCSVYWARLLVLLVLVFIIIILALSGIGRTVYCWDV